MMEHHSNQLQQQQQQDQNPNQSIDLNNINNNHHPHQLFSIPNSFISSTKNDHPSSSTQQQPSTSNISSIDHPSEDQSKITDLLNDLENQLEQNFRSIASILKFNLQLKRLNVYDFYLDNQNNSKHPSKASGSLGKNLPLPKHLTLNFKRNVLRFDGSLQKIENFTQFARAVIQRDLKRAKDLAEAEARAAASVAASQIPEFPSVLPEVVTQEAPSTEPNEQVPITVDDDLSLSAQKTQTAIDLTCSDDDGKTQAEGLRPENGKSNNDKQKPTTAEVRSPSIEIQGDGPNPTAAAGLEEVPRPGVNAPSPEIEIETTPKPSTEKMTDLTKEPPENSSSNESTPLNSTAPMKIDPPTQAEPIVATIKSASDDTDGDLFGDESLFGSSNHSSAGPSPTLDAPTVSVEKTLAEKANVPSQIELGSSPEKPLAVEESNKSQEEGESQQQQQQQQHIVSDSNSFNPKSDLPSTSNGDSTNLASLEPPEDLTEFLTSFIATHRDSESNGQSTLSLNSQKRTDQMAGTDNDPNPLNSQQLNELIMSISASHGSNVNENSGLVEGGNMIDGAGNFGGGDLGIGLGNDDGNNLGVSGGMGIDESVMNELDEISKFLAPNNSSND